ncbi:STAS domain-containing protein [Streptomyces sp. N35]|uniref:STAS domain-containing protein n=1 Tax=Streptomyces sp. N35 TaxID=2795730 RepID=UPI0018F5FEBC|nr:STAS domain-containing protein [Streptomyces sp. N35]
MRVRPDLFDECRLVTAEGELDLTTITPFTQALWDSRNAAGCPFLIVDLSLVSFMDSSVLSPLNDAWTDCSHRHGWVRVIYHNRLGLLFRASGGNSHFPRYHNRRNAWQGLAGP